MSERKGQLFVVSGPSGVGKGTVIKELLSRRKDLYYSISATTRSPRQGEQHGINYYFLEREDFLRRRDAGDFLEWADVYGNYYGTLREEVMQRVEEGLQVILEIDIQGAMKVQKLHPEAIFVFVLPPSMQELQKRIVNRGSESQESLRIRMQSAMEEIMSMQYYDYFVVNDEVEMAASTLDAILRAEQARVQEDVIEWLEERASDFNF